MEELPACCYLCAYDLLLCYFLLRQAHAAVHTRSHVVCVCRVCACRVCRVCRVCRACVSCVSWVSVMCVCRVCVVCVRPVVCRMCVVCVQSTKHTHKAPLQQRQVPQKQRWSVPWGRGITRARSISACGPPCGKTHNDTRKKHLYNK